MSSPRPPDWNKTLRELLAEGRGVSGQEIQWARSYERDQLRAWARFPKPGEVYELLEDAEVSFVTHWDAPYTGGGKGKLRKGSRIRVVDDISDEEPLAVGAIPLAREEAETALVPEAERSAEKYAGFSLSVTTSELNRLFRLVEV
jgi:hypothetical protein